MLEPEPECQFYSKATNKRNPYFNLIIAVRETRTMAGEWNISDLFVM